MKRKDKETKLMKIILSLTNPWTIISVIIIAFCTVCMIHEFIATKDYKMIELTYVSDCSKYKICDNHYMYMVDDTIYGISPAFETIEKLKKKNYAYYKEDNPKKAIMKSSWGIINIFFVIVIIVSTLNYYKSMNREDK